jgi:thioredoxin-like negative regulator of GroEL
MTYTLARSPGIVIRDEDQAHIPDDLSNRDYQEYLAWFDEGNTPNPYVPPMPSAEAAIAASAQALALSNAKSLAAQGRTDEALAALIKLMEQA